MDREQNPALFQEMKHVRNSFLAQLLQIDVTDMNVALNRTAMLLAKELDADKVDVFLYDEAQRVLIASGISDTPMGRLQQQLGLNRLSIEAGGTVAQVFQNGLSLRIGDVKQDPRELEAVKYDLGVASSITTPLVVGERCYGVIQADSAQVDYFTEADLSFLEGLTHWVGIVVDHAQLAMKQRQQAVDEGRRLAAQELMTILAHDLRNYLTPLRMRIDTLNRRAVREQRQRDVEGFRYIKDTFQSVEELINDVMDTSRLSRGLLTLDFEPCDLVQLLTKFILPFQDTTHENIVLQVPPGLIVRVDVQRLQQAFANILANALKYAPPGSTIEITAITRVEEGLVDISVKDDGPGVALELLPFLFQPFRTGLRSSGLGLGLYLAQQFIQAHGGMLTIDESYKQGARFLITLPLYDPVDKGSQ